MKKDQFRIIYDPAVATPEQMLETVRNQGFRAEVVNDAFAGSRATGNARRDLARLPEVLRKEFQQAKEAGKPLLLAFHGTGCPPCKRMDTVTYPNDKVKQELSNWMLLKVDIEEHPEVAELFEVVGIPVAVAVTADGEEFGRVENFVEPAEFRARLGHLLLAKPQLRPDR